MFVFTSILLLCCLLSGLTSVKTQTERVVVLFVFPPALCSDVSVLVLMSDRLSSFPFELFFAACSYLVFRSSAIVTHGETLAGRRVRGRWKNIKLFLIEGWLLL